MASPDNVGAGTRNALDEPFNFELELERFILNIKPLILPIIIIVIVGIIITTMTIVNKNKRDLHIAEAYAELQKAMIISLDDSSDQASLEKKATEKREILDNIIADYSDTSAVIDAEFYKASIDFSLKKYIDAISGFKNFYSKYPDAQPFSIKAKIAEANCYLAQHNFAEARNKFTTVINDSQNAAKLPYFLEQAKFQLVLCNILTDKFEEASTLLNDILASSNDDVLKKKVQSILAKLEIVSGPEFKNAILPLTAADSAVEEKSSETDPIVEEGTADKTESTVNE